MSFADFFPKEKNNIAIDHFSTESLSALPYEVEAELKNNALRQMLKKADIKTVPQMLHTSPLPRKYRTTSKRRVFFDGKKVYLHFGRKHGKETLALSQLEIDEHIQIYRCLQQIFSMPRNFKASAALNYFIIRGSYTEYALIFNVRRLDGDIVRILKAVSADITHLNPDIRSVFLYVDEKGSDYYLEAERPEKGIAFKKLHGPEFLALRLGDKKFLYSPTSFSQINESILPVFFREFMKYIPDDTDKTLCDLYCGYGIWSLAAGDKFKSVWGMELSQESVKSARNNAKFHYPGKNFRYESNFITEEVLKSKMPPVNPNHEYILLDPPRKGCASGVYEYLISRRPQKIFQLFCGADEIVPALNIYLNNNCKIEALIPFDFFPGTLNIELLAVISCGRN